MVKRRTKIIRSPNLIGIIKFFKHKLYAVRLVVNDKYIVKMFLNIIFIWIFKLILILMSGLTN